MLLDRIEQCLRNFPTIYETDHYYFVHATLTNSDDVYQTPEVDRLWSYWNKNKVKDFDKKVVYGHVPYESPRIKPYRLGLDTGACKGGKLTCGILDGDKYPPTFLQVS